MSLKPYETIKLKDKLMPLEKQELTNSNEMILRKLLWLNHGHDNLYGDDGEMQCAECCLDFKRDSVDIIQLRLRG